MSEKKRGSSLQVLVAGLLLLYGLYAIALVSFFGGLLLILAALATYPKTREMAIAKFERINKTHLTIFSVISAIFGLSFVSAGVTHQQKVFLEENPEIAKQLEQEKTAKAQKNIEENIKIELLTFCELAVKKQLKDPQSYSKDFSSASYEILNGEHVIEFEYRANNSFGAPVKSSAECTFNDFAQMTNFSAGN